MDSSAGFALAEVYALLSALVFVINFNVYFAFYSQMASVLRLLICPHP